MISDKFVPRAMLLSALASPLAALAGPGYTVAFAPDGFTIIDSSSSKLNNRGQVLGVADDLPAIWQGSRVTSIPALAGHFASGINNRGELVGSSGNGPFVYTASGLRYLRITSPLEFNLAEDLNDAREVIGSSQDPLGEEARAFLHTRRGTELIGTFGGDYSDATGLNNAGYVVGHSGLPTPNRGGEAQAFLYRNGVMRNLGALGGIASFAWDINDAGQVVGRAELPKPPGSQSDYGPFHAFLYYRGAMRDLGTLGGTESNGIAINKDGVVVGQATLAGNRELVAFVYAHHRMTDLNTRVRLAPGWTLRSASDINDQGQILAQACYLDDCRYWARLTPLRRPRHVSSAEEERGEAAERGDGN